VLDISLTGGAIACWAGIEVLRVTRAVSRRAAGSGIGRSISWYAGVGISALLATACTDADRRLAAGAALAAVTGLVLVALGAALGFARRPSFFYGVERPGRLSIGHAARHIAIAALWAPPLAAAVSELLERTAGFPRVPVFCNTVALTLVGSSFTPDRHILLAGLKCTVAVAAAAVAALGLQWDPSDSSAADAPDTTAWMAAAVLLFGSVLTLSDSKTRRPASN
jgi:hypothetical protein